MKGSMAVAVALLVGSGLVDMGPAVTQGQGGPFLVQSRAMWAAGYGPAGPRHIPIPDRGTLVLDLPESWRASADQPPVGVPPTVTIKPTTGEKFFLLLSVVWRNAAQPQVLSREQMREFAERAGESSLPRALETRPVVREYSANGKTGYYVRLSSQVSQPGDYRYLTQGAIGDRDLVLGFAFFSNNDTAADEQAVLGIVAAARREDR